MNTDSGLICLAWEAPKAHAKAPIDSYRIEMITGFMNDFEHFAQVNGETLTFDAADLKPGQKYNFRIKAVNSAGVSTGTQLEKAVPAAPPSVGERSCALCLSQVLVQFSRITVACFCRNVQCTFCMGD